MIVLGKNETEQNNISVRSRDGRKMDSILLDEFISSLNEEMENFDK